MGKLCTNKNRSYKHNEQINKQTELRNSLKFKDTLINILVFTATVKDIQNILLICVLGASFCQCPLQFCTCTSSAILPHLS
jgi:hypothetical protein